MNKITRIVLILLLGLLLVAIRGYFEPYFYDPFIKFYKSNYLTQSFPKLNLVNYFFNVFLRYFINSTISLLIIYLLFLNKNYLIFSVKFYTLAFVLLCILLCALVVLHTQNLMLLFYVRRFLIQPLFLVVLILAFYYYRKNGQSNPKK